MSMARSSSATVTNRNAALRRKSAFMDLVASGMQIKDALAQQGIPYKTYEGWRWKDPHFKAQMEHAKLAKIRDWTALPGKTGVATFDFGAERSYFFGHESPPFQLEVVQAMEHLAPGDILLVILPPEHGKTTLYEDWATLRLAHNPSLRHHIGSESISLSRKILGRIRDRLENTMADPRMTDLICKHGPFAPPQDATKRRGQPWAATHFDVWGKGQFDERDYSMAALGFGSQIIGSRSDHLHADDLQSMKTIGQTESMVNTFKQDWLSRPGEKGFTTIMGNRIDEGDIYEAFIETFDSDILHVIKYPAIVDNGQGEAIPLWPGWWTMEKLDRMRRKVGDQIWERNWMQRPRSKLFGTFDEQTIDRCKLPLRPIGHIEKGAAHVIGLDPAIGTRKTMGAGRNAVVTCQFDSNGITPVLIREDQNLTNYTQILGVVEDHICTIQAGGGFVSDVVIEENAFQKGLAADTQLKAMQDSYHFAVRPHVSGVNKYDENIGIPSMVHSMLKGQVHLPWADDDLTRLWVGELRAQMLAWRPRVSGVALRQDLLMATWFVWLLWRNRKGVAMAPQNRRGGWMTDRKLPYGEPTRSLVLPRGVVPSVLAGRP